MSISTGAPWSGKGWALVGQLPLASCSRKAYSWSCRAYASLGCFVSLSRTPPHDGVDGAAVGGDGRRGPPEEPEPEKRRDH
jgi:hypothetical protein